MKVLNNRANDKLDSSDKNTEDLWNKIQEYIDVRFKNVEPIFLDYDEKLNCLVLQKVILGVKAELYGVNNASIDIDPFSAKNDSLGEIKLLADFLVEFNKLVSNKNIMSKVEAFRESYLETEVLQKDVNSKIRSLDMKVANKTQKYPKYKAFR